MAKEYIEREATIAGIESLLQEKANEKDSLAYFAFTLFAETLKKAPTADVVEVVRCKDCMHWIYYADEKRCICDLHCTRTNRDDFCSFGI